MTDTEKLDRVLNNTQEILSLLKTGKALPDFTERPQQRSTGADPDAAVTLEQPRQVIGDADECVIHFGFCKDMTIAQCDAQGKLHWLLTKWRPRARERDGMLWPEDERLWNSIRTYWHRKQGTLAGMYVENRPKAEERDAKEMLSADKAKTDTKCPF